MKVVYKMRLGDLKLHEDGFYVVLDLDTLKISEKTYSAVMKVKDDFVNLNGDGVSLWAGDALSNIYDFGDLKYVSNNVFVYRDVYYKIVSSDSSVSIFKINLDNDTYEQEDANGKLYFPYIIGDTLFIKYFVSHTRLAYFLFEDGNYTGCILNDISRFSWSNEGSVKYMTNSKIVARSKLLEQRILF